MFRWLVIGFLAGLWLSLEEAQCNCLSNYSVNTKSVCHDTGSAKTCFATFLTNSNQPVRESLETTSHWCNATVPGSTVILIKSVESQGTVEIFIGRQVLATETIAMDAQKLLASVSFEWTWINGQETLPIDISGDQCYDTTCVESENGQSLAYCLGYVKSQYNYRCEYPGSFTGALITPAKSDDGNPRDSSNKQCICICSQSKRRSNMGDATYDGKWWSCNCSYNHAIVCKNDEGNSDAVTTETRATEETLSLTSADFKSSPSVPGLSNINATLLILLLLVAVAFIVVAVILIIRKRKYARRHEVSPLKTTAQNEAVPPEYETMVPDNRPSGGIVPIYTELELTQQPTPSNSTTYASIQPTSEMVDMGKSVEYVDLDLPKKDQQKPTSADNVALSLSPIYSQPFEPPTSDSNTDYVEPYKPDKAPTATAPVQSHQAAGGQQNIYSLAKAIPSGDPSVISSEPNKATKSSTPTGKPVKDPIYLNVIEVKPGDGSEGVAIQDPSAVYAEPIKLKKSS